MITGYIPTSRGLELEFEWLDKVNKVDKKDIVLPILATDGNSATEDEDIEQELEIANKKSQKQSSKQKQSNKQSNKQSSNQYNKYNVSMNLPDNVRKVIIDMKQTGATPKKIQFDIKRHYQIDIGQQQIRELI
jgi:hypothetical protein